MKSYALLSAAMLVVSHVQAQTSNSAAGSAPGEPAATHEAAAGATADPAPITSAAAPNVANTPPAPPAVAVAPAVAPPAANPPAAGGMAAAESPPGPRPSPAGPMKIETPNATLKFGFLLQPQYEDVGSGSLSRGSQNLFLRRTRILVGATLFKNFEFFFDTDYPNLNKAPNAPSGEPNPKATPGMNVQDAFATVKAIDDALMIDLGYMLPPLSHNAVQGATTLYGWDYFSNSFRHSNVFGSSSDPVGRDTGVELRGFLIDHIFEYRVGLFQGKREPASNRSVASRNFFRTAARLQINLLDPETGFFYAGSYLGTKRILSFGVSYDFQEQYHHSSGDGILDMPLGPGVITAQADVSHWTGGSWVALPNQTALMTEAGYLIDAINLGPIIRVERRWVKNETAAAPSETRWGGGLAYWPYGHNVNLKAFYTRVSPHPAVHDYNQLNVQAQFFVF